LKLILPFVALVIIFLLSSKEPVKRRILIIDSGVNPYPELKPFLCNDGHKSFLIGDQSNPLDDRMGHGTMIAKVISEYIDPNSNCLVIYRSFAKKGGAITTRAYMYGLIEANNHKYEAIVIAMEDEGYYNDEIKLFKELSQKSRIFIAAGNHTKDLDKKCDVYPACLAAQINSKNFRVVGDEKGEFNLGKLINEREPSEFSLNGLDYKGTSVSTARAAARYVIQIEDNSQSRKEKNRRSISSK
jgi:hypothetical protein